MICPQCGKQIPDQSQFCNYCGARLAIQASPANTEGATQVINTVDSRGTAPMPPATQAGYAQQPHGQHAYAQPAAAPAGYYATPVTPMAPVAAPKKKGKAGKIIAAILVLAALAAVGFFALRTFVPAVIPQNSPTEVVEKAARSALNLDFDHMLDALPPEMLDYAISHTGMSTREELIAYLNDNVAQLDEQTQAFGFDARTLLKVIQVDTSNVSYYSQDGLDSLKKEWNTRITGFGDTFEEAATVTMNISGEIDLFGQTLSLSDYIGSASQDVTTVRIGDKWYLLEADLDELMSMY